MNPYPARTRSGVRDHLSVLLIALAMIAGVVALNWPVTFANASSPATTVERAATLNAQTESNAETETASIADVAAAANQAVVTITNYQPERNPFTGQTEGGEPIPYGVGSGYIIDKDGYVVTNHHVVAGGTEFTVELIDGTTLDATLVGSDAFQDVAVLQLDLEPGQTVPATLAWGDSDTVRAGDEVIAIGSPYGEYTNTISEGSVGAVDRVLNAGDGYAMPNLIQHSAPIYEGNSGGPLLNTNGEVIGMNVAKATSSRMGLNQDDQSGIGFAIESNAVKEIVVEIVETGGYARPYLGISSQSSRFGQEVLEVEDGTPAADAGLRAGDLITGIDGESISSRNPFLNVLIFDHEPGDTVTLSVLRDGEEISIEVTLGVRPAETQ